MGVADFAFTHSVGFSRRSTSAEATEIVLEPQEAGIVAKNKSGQELYRLTQDAEGEYSMRDREGHAVLQRRPDDLHPEDTSKFSIYDRRGQMIAQSGSSAFTWERLAISWTPKSLSLISDTVLVAHEETHEGSPTSPKSPKDGNLAELTMASAKHSGTLRVPAIVMANTGTLPPLGLFLFEAMVLNQEYIHSNALRRLSMSLGF